MSVKDANNTFNSTINALGAMGTVKSVSGFDVVKEEPTKEEDIKPI